MKNFPIPIQKILPVVLLAGVSAAVFSGYRSSVIAPVEASTTRSPGVSATIAPAGTVLRVKMSQALDADQSRPGDRFEGVLDAPVMVGEVEVLVKGTPVFGHVVAAGRSESSGRVILALTLDGCELPGREIAIATSSVTRAGGSLRRELKLRGLSGFARNGEPRVSVAAESIMGFTLTGTLTA